MGASEVKIQAQGLYINHAHLKKYILHHFKKTLILKVW